MKAQLKNWVFLSFATVVGSFVSVWPVQAQSCTHYASPTGTGNGLSSSSPFKISSFWSVAGPGKTLCLLDGTYKGLSSMIMPPSGLNGTSVSPIRIKAVNDGAVLIDGENARNPLILRNNDWFIIEGINARRSSGTVVLISSLADNNIIRRVCGWDTQVSANNHVFQIDSGSKNLLEDVCAFGVGRKIFEIYRAPGGNTIRRAWGQWSRSTASGPKLTYSLGYNSRNSLCENCIGTWDDTPMGSSSIDQPTSILGMGTYSGCTNNKYFGSLAYIRSADKVRGLGGVAREADNDADCFTYQDTVIYIQPGSHTSLKPFLLTDDTVGGTSKILNRATEVGGGTSLIQKQWVVTGRHDTNSAPSGTTSIWNGSSSSGARLCKRYQNGVLTTQPLWPWPMDQRIRAALSLAGKSPDSVFGGTGRTLTTLLESFFGSIPSTCKTSTSSASAKSNLSAASASEPNAPSAPEDLVVSP